MDTIILIIVTLLIILVSAWAVVIARKTMQTGKGLIDEEAPVLERYATVQEKLIEKVMIGTYQMPGHYLAYHVQFRFDDGEETDILVPQEIFDDIPIGSRELLITQNGNFIDFGGRLGEDIPNEDANR